MSSWEALVREHGPTTFRSAWRVLQNIHDAEDVTQEVLLELYRKPPSSLITSGLLACVAVRRATDLLRRRRPHLLLDDETMLSSVAGPEREAMERELVANLSQAVAGLPPRQAEVFCLRYLHDMPYEQIAHHLAISRDAVAAALHQARARLRECLRTTNEEQCR